MSEPRSPDPIEQTRAWVRERIIGLNLCPFAAPVENAGLVRYAALSLDDGRDPLQFALEEAVLLLEAAPSEVATSLLVYPRDLADFPGFLQLVAELEGALSAAGADGVLQVATFHPDYVFEGADPDDPANGTNRAPFPTVHLIREDDVSRAVASHPDPASIPVRNAALLRGLAK